MKKLIFALSMAGLVATTPLMYAAQQPQNMKHLGIGLTGLGLAACAGTAVWYWARKHSLKKQERRIAQADKAVKDIPTTTPETVKELHAQLPLPWKLRDESDGYDTQSATRSEKRFAYINGLTNYKANTQGLNNADKKAIAEEAAKSVEPADIEEANSNATIKNIFFNLPKFLIKPTDIYSNDEETSKEAKKYLYFDNLRRQHLELLKMKKNREQNQKQFKSSKVPYALLFGSGMVLAGAYLIGFGNKKA